MSRSLRSSTPCHDDHDPRSRCTTCAGERVGHYHRNAQLDDCIVKAPRRSRITSRDDAELRTLQRVLHELIHFTEAFVSIRLGLAIDVSRWSQHVAQTVQGAVQLLSSAHALEPAKQALPEVGRLIVYPALRITIPNFTTDMAVILDAARPGNQANEGVLLRNAVGPPLLLWNSVGQRKEGTRSRRFGNAPLFHSREHRIQGDLVDVDVSSRDLANRRPSGVDLSRFESVAEHPRVQLRGDPDVVPSRMPLPPLARLQRIIEGPQTTLSWMYTVVVVHRWVHLPTGEHVSHWKGVKVKASR
eukprot:scaffold5657_cov270-Pinguiococcus_pyrenoidosus.AAC.2